MLDEQRRVVGVPDDDIGGSSDSGVSVGAFATLSAPLKVD